MRGLHFVLIASVLAGTSMIECSNDNTCTDAGSCVDSGTIPTVSGGGCDSSKAASQGGCAVDDSDGFFVSVNGDDTAAGTKVAPFKTIGKGIAAAAAAPLKPNVYVCAGKYPENLVVQNAPAGVALHGGFDCASWAQTNAVTEVAPLWVGNLGKPQFVLHVNGSAALVEGLTLTAPDATDPSASSQAVLIAGSPGMTFRRASVVAGAGADGTTPTPPAAATAAMAGHNGASQVWAPAISCACTSDTSLGGQGGGMVDGGVVNPEAGAPVVNGDNTKGQPGIYGGPPQCNGGNGGNGLVGKTGASTNTLGTLSALQGWLAASGSTGDVGGTGQGGGGGWWAVVDQSLGGGGGACGGCGGKGGEGGAGGGASIALEVLSSTLRIQNASIRAGKAGNGGNGSLGQAGQPGGTGGTGTPCTGGIGGTGGGGGSGGGGAGGVSIAIATVATTPDIDQQSTIVAGNGGLGGKDGSAVQSKAIDGVADVVHAF